jgi:transposase-like protein
MFRRVETCTFIPKWRLKQRNEARNQKADGMKPRFVPSGSGRARGPTPSSHQQVWVIAGKRGSSPISVASNVRELSFDILPCSTPITGWPWLIRLEQLFETTPHPAPYPRFKARNGWLTPSGSATRLGGTTKTRRYLWKCWDCGATFSARSIPTRSGAWRTWPRHTMRRGGMRRRRRSRWKCWDCGARFSARSIPTLSRLCMTSLLPGIADNGALKP